MWNGFICADVPLRNYSSVSQSLNHCYDMRSFGVRTVNKIANVTGIVGYSVGFLVDSAGGRGLSGPPEYISVPPKQEQLVLSIPATNLQDGDTIVVWFIVTDIAGNRDEVRLTVGLDRTAPKIDGDEFQKKTVDDFTSRYKHSNCCLLHFIRRQKWPKTVLRGSSSLRIHSLTASQHLSLLFSALTCM